MTCHQNRSRELLFPRLVIVTSLVLSIPLVAIAEELVARSAHQEVKETAEIVESPETNPTSEDDSDTHARLFAMRCTGCHTIGRGPLTGPDLVTAMTWPAPDLEIAVRRMIEKVGPMNDEEIRGVTALLKDPSIKERLASEETRIAQSFATKLEPPSSIEGARLFDGRSLFENGGMSCIACHRAGSSQGGTLGPDLLGVYGRMGEIGLRSACEKTNFKIMSALYRNRPLTIQEAAHLTSFFALIEEKPRQSEATLSLEASGMVLTLVFLVAMAFAYRLRMKAPTGKRS